MIGIEKKYVPGDRFFHRHDIPDHLAAIHRSLTPSRKDDSVTERDRMILRILSTVKSERNNSFFFQNNGLVQHSFSLGL